VEAATGPDRDIDYDVARVFGKAYRPLTEREREDFSVDVIEQLPGVPVIPLYYSASFDAALALVEEKFPEWRMEQLAFETERHNGRLSTRVVAGMGNCDNGVFYKNAQSEPCFTPALATLSMLIRATMEHKECPVE